MTEKTNEYDAGSTGDADGDACDHAIETDSDQSGPVAATGTRRAVRPRINFYLDVTIALILAALIGTGILLEWVLPPGIRGGRGLTWLGERRHFWGDVHFWLAALTTVMVVVHLLLHTSWIAQCWKRSLGSLRSPVTWGVIGVVLAAIVLPLGIPAQRGASRQHRGRGIEAMDDGEHRGRGSASEGLDWHAPGARMDGSGRGWRGGRRGR